MFHMDPELLTTDPSRPDPEPRGKPKATRYLVAGALVAVGVTIGALFSPIGLAGAQSDDSDDSGTDTGTDTADERPGRGDHRFGRLLTGMCESVDDLAEMLDMTSEELVDELASGASLAEIAEARDVDVDEVANQLLDQLETRLDEAVAEDIVDEERADEILARATERIDDLIDGELPGLLEGRFDDLDLDGDLDGDMDGGHWHRGPRFGHGVWTELDELMESLGLSTDDVLSGLAEEKSLAEMAAEAGVSEDELIDAIVSAANERIDAAVEDGWIDADEAEEKKAELAERVPELITKTPPGVFGLGREPGPGGHGFPGGWDDEGETEESSLATT
jgi:ribosomal protein S20